MEVAQDAAGLLIAGDFDKLTKHEKEEFHAMQERMAQYLIQQSNHYQSQFPGLRLDFRFQVEIYQSVQINPGTIRYSTSRVY